MGADICPSKVTAAVIVGDHRTCLFSSSEKTREVRVCLKEVNVCMTLNKHSMHSNALRIFARKKTNKKKRTQKRSPGAGASSIREIMLCVFKVLMHLLPTFLSVHILHRVKRSSMSLFSHLGSILEYIVFDPSRGATLPVWQKLTGIHDVAAFIGGRER